MMVEFIWKGSEGGLENSTSSMKRGSERGRGEGCQWRVSLESSMVLAVVNVDVVIDGW